MFNTGVETMGDLCFGNHSPGLAPRGCNQPRLKSRRIFDVVQLLKERCEDILKNLGSLIFIEARAKRDRINQALIAPYKFFPCKLVPAAAREYQLHVALFHCY